MRADIRPETDTRRGVASGGFCFLNKETPFRRTEWQKFKNS
jgi:hypothetical protein